MHSNADVIVRCMLFRSRDMINGLIGLESEQYVKSVARGNNMVKSSSNYWISGRTIPTKGTHKSVKQLQRFPQIKITMWNENKNKNKFLDYSQSNRQHVCRKQIITLVTIKHLFDFHTRTHNRKTRHSQKQCLIDWIWTLPISHRIIIVRPLVFWVATIEIEIKINDFRQISLSLFLSLLNSLFFPLSLFRSLARSLTHSLSVWIS